MELNIFIILSISLHISFLMALAPFLFSHVDPFNSKLKLERRIQRLLSFRKSDEKKIFVYHHRSSIGYIQPFSNIIFKAFKDLSRVYKNSFFLCLTHRTTSSDQGADVKLSFPKSNICFSTISSTIPWGGEESNFHALHDDRILLTTLKSVESYFKMI